MYKLKRIVILLLTAVLLLASCASENPGNSNTDNSSGKNADIAQPSAEAELVSEQETESFGRVLKDTRGF